MKLHKILFGVMMLCSALTATSCIGDLDVTPIDPNINTSDKALTNEANFEAFLAQCYTGYATSGSYGPDGASNISGLDGGQSQYFRGLFHLNEYTTDETVVGWNDQTIQDLHGLAWTADDTFVAALYYRIFYQIAMCNEFIRQAQQTSVTLSKKDEWIAEARALRAFSYLHAIDMFGNVPFADEKSSVGATAPQRITREDLFAWLETELKDIIDNSALGAARQTEYGHIDKGAARMVLAKLYLNAEVYIGTPKYTECAQVCKAIQQDGYSLNPKYAELFMADNNLRTNEIMFAIEQDGTNTRSYGVTNFIILASLGGKMEQSELGVGASGWGGIRTTPEFYDSFQAGDKRSMFHTADQQKEIDDISNFQNGYAFVKFTNKTSTGGVGFQGSFVDTDFPVYRYADVLLMLAECAKRGATGVTEAEGVAALNAVRTRAGLPAMTTYTLDDILRERGCELYLECHRRSDLIRFGKFTTNAYLWSWKGGVKGGKAVGDHFNLFPIPNKDLGSNPNLLPNPGYNK